MRVLATVCFAFAAGVAAAQYLLPQRLLWYAALGCAALGLLWALVLRDDNRLRARLIGFGLAAGLLWNGGHALLIRAPFEAMVGETVMLVMEAADYPSETEYGSRVEVRIDAPGLHGRALYDGGEDPASIAAFPRRMPRAASSSCSTTGERRRSRMETRARSAIFRSVLRAGCSRPSETYFPNGRWAF